MKPSILSSLALGALLLASLTGPHATLQAGQPPTPDDLLQKAEAVQVEAQELKAAGRHEAAMRLQREVEELRAHAQELQNAGLHNQTEPPSPEARRQLLQQQRRLRVELREHQAAGNHDKAAELDRQIARLQRAAGHFPEQREQPNAPRYGASRRNQPEPRDLPSSDLEEMERRMHHVEVAVEHLHAAGLHDAAERLAQELARRREQAPPPRSVQPTPERWESELRELHAQLNELRANLQEVREQMRGLHPERQ